MKNAKGPTEGQRNPDVRESREAALALSGADGVQFAEVSSVLALQTALQHGERYGYWSTPNKWKPGEQSKVVMNVDLRGRIIHFLPKELQQAICNEVTEASRYAQGDAIQRMPSKMQRALDELVLLLTRYLVVLRMGPAGMGRKKGGLPLGPSNISSIAYGALPPMFALALTKSIAGFATGKYLNNLVLEDFDVLPYAQKNSVLMEARRMHILSERGYWSDVPVLHQELPTVTSVAGAAVALAEQPKRDPHRPLPDDYVSQMAQCSIWLVQDLAPNLLAIAKEVRQIWARTEDVALTPNSVQSRRIRALGPFLSSFVWRDHLGQPIVQPPFPLRFSQRGKNSRGSKRKLEAAENFDAALEHEPDDASTLSKVEWPPRSQTDVFGLLHNVQLAHMFVVLLSTGARKSEALDWHRDCIERAANGLPYANGRTFKLVERIDGELRDWVLPDIAVHALEQQVRLVTLLESIGRQRPVRKTTQAAVVSESQHLWVQSVRANDVGHYAPLKALNFALVKYAKTLGMEVAPGGQSLRTHRFRKTVARMCALALTQAPKVLMDVFGHKSIEMTLYYILTDKDLQAEVEKVSRELKVMRAKEVIEKMVESENSPTSLTLGGYGGPAALSMQRAIESYREGVHRRGEDFGSESIIELAEVLTLQGKAWQVVRKGVMCTKLPGTESGLCNKSKGHPEPSKCRSRCDHRLEEGFLREDVDASIGEAVAAYLVSERDGESLAKAFWAGQIRVHVDRFEDLRVKWMDNPTVQQVAQRVKISGVAV